MWDTEKIALRSGMGVIEALPKVNEMYDVDTRFIRSIPARANGPMATPYNRGGVRTVSAFTLIGGIVDYSD
jgi:hypothetical protein